jgi:Flp pilus assembly protein TadD
MLENAIRVDPANRSAHQRLGILALSHGDFDRAVSALGMAWHLDADHRGVRKTLGYALVWAGDLERALPLLSQIPEAPSEMGYYAWWWETNGDRELAQRSAAMEQLLQRGDPVRDPEARAATALSVLQSAVIVP